MSDLIKGHDGSQRCGWCGTTPEMMDYHDNEWGIPVSSDHHLFERLCLESFQSGLSWRTVLSKRENFRAAFHNFDFDQIAMFKHNDVERLLQNKGIIRHRGKIEAVINNAKRAQELVKLEGSLSSYFWRHEPAPKTSSKPQTLSTSIESKALATDLKERGWKFLGPTTMYSFMQALGLINDHAVGCMARGKVELARDNFKKGIKKKTIYSG